MRSCASKNFEVFVRLRVITHMGVYIHAAAAVAACPLEILLVVDDVRATLKQYEGSPHPNVHAAAAAAAWMYVDTL